MENTQCVKCLGGTMRKTSARKIANVKRLVYKCDKCGHAVRREVPIESADGAPDK